MAITRVQGNARQTTTSSSISVTLDSAPVQSNLLIAVIGMRAAAGGEGVSSISQTGVTWAQQVYRQNSNGTGYVGIWAGVVGAGASTSVTVNLNKAADRGAVANICEYSGLRTSDFLDKTATSYNGPVTQTDTGTTATTTKAEELWIGGIETAWKTQTNPTNGFMLFDGQKYSQTAVAYLEKIVSSQGQANSGTTCDSTYYVGCIATFKEGSTIVVPYNGRYAGNGSKQDTIDANGADTIIMQVQSNVPDNLDGSAVIENLIIDGKNYSGTTGILLQNVYNCCIRNLTIKDCDVGIHVDLTDDHWSHANRFEHIRLMNVKTGILFTGTSGYHDFSHTIIDDVGISVKDDADAIGIKIGDSYANVYNAFIKATVWLGDSTGKGMEVNGQLKLSLVNLEVEGSGGTGLYVNSGAYVTDNQSFLLTTGGVSSSLGGSGTTDNSLIQKGW